MLHPITRRATIAALCASSVLVIAACGSSDSASATKPTKDAPKAAASAFPLTIKRDGRTITFTKAPKRILVKDAEAASIIGPAGGNLTGRIVALAAENSDGVAPPEPALSTMKNVPRIEPNNGNIAKEAIIGQKPDLVFAHDLSSAPPAQLKAVGIDALMANICGDSWAKAHGGDGSFQEIYEDVELLGKLLGTERYAANSIAKMKQTVAAISAKGPELRKRLSKPTAGIAFFYQGGFYTYGKSSMAEPQAKALGLKNAFGDLKARGTQLNGEEFIKRDPGFIVIAVPFKKGETQQQAKARVLKVPGIKKMTAVRQDHVLVVSGGFVLGRAVEGLQAMADAISTYK